MGSILTCECGEKNENNGQMTPPYLEEEENVKLRESQTVERQRSYRKLESHRKNSIQPIHRKRFMTENRKREAEMDEQPMGERFNSIARTDREFDGNNSTQSPFLNTDRRRVSVTTRSMRSSEFTQDHELVHQIFDELRNDKVKKNYKAIARSLVGLVDLLRDMTMHKDEYENYDSAQLDKAKTQAFKQICQTVQEITSQPQELFQFAFELRKIDTLNKYSLPILGQNIKSDALIKLICANDWNPKNLKMAVNMTNKFKIQLGKGTKSIQLRKNFGANLQFPIIDDSKVSLMYCDTITFELKKQGTVLIVSNGCRLACQNLDYDEQEALAIRTVVWVKNSHALFVSDEATEWFLTSTTFKGCTGGGNANQVYIEMHQDDGCHDSLQRLILNRKKNVLEVVGQYSPLFDDQCWTNKWQLVQQQQ